MKRQESAPLIAQIVTIALLIGSLPVATSPVLLAHDSVPAFTLNVCHPLPPFTIRAVSRYLPRLATFSFEQEAAYQGVMPDFVPAASRRLIAAPDPPPPKSLI